MPYRFLFILVTIIVSCSSPDPETQPGNAKWTGIDDVGREIRLDEIPRRIVSLAPNATEILFSLGAGDRVVGVTDYCNHPPEVKVIKKVGSFSFLNIERILSVAPDFIVLSSHEQERFIKTLEDLGIPVYVCFPQDFDELFRSISTIGKLTGTEKRGDVLVDSLKNELDRLKVEVEETFGEGERPKVYFEISSRPLMTVGENSFIGNLIKVSGGMNVGRDIPRDYAVINSEVIINRNPDIIFIFQSSSNRESVAKRLGWERIRAVKEGRVFDNLDEDRILRPGPRSIQGARDIYDHLRSVKGVYDEDLDRN